MISMLNIIDIASYQAGLNLEKVFACKQRGKKLHGVVVKTTEGTSYINPYAKEWLDWLKDNKKIFGFYHFASGGYTTRNAREEADFFIKHSRDWFGYGVPVLDWETDYCNIEWVNAFVKRVHDKTGVWCMIYANAWRITDKVNMKCPRWVANYPDWFEPDFNVARRNKNMVDYCPGKIVMWQFCSDGRFPYYDGQIDCNLFYGWRKDWRRIARGDS